MISVPGTIPDLPVSLSGVCSAFDFDGPLELVAFHSGISGAWQVRLAGGEDISLKVLTAFAPGYQLDQLRTSDFLERRALAANLDIVPPIPPVVPAIGLAARIDDHLVWAHRWIEHGGNGRQVTGDELHRWLGNTLATLHTLAPATRDREANLAQAYGIFPDTDWLAWFAQAERAGLPWLTAAFELRPVIAEATRLVQAALADPHQPRCISHRDLNPPNVLAGPTGPLLCDFGSSGIDVPWFEAVDVALSFDQEEPITLHSYLAANGLPGPESTEALARQPGRTMSFLAFSMWLSLGHRPVTDRQREEATARIPALMRDLSTQVESLDANRRMLFGR